MGITTQLRSVLLLLAGPCVLLMHGAAADGNIVYISQTRGVAVEGTVTPNNHAAITQSSSRSATGFGSFSASLDADPLYQPAGPNEYLSATAHADMTSQLLGNQIIAKGHLNVDGVIGTDANFQDLGTVAASATFQFGVTFRTTHALRYHLLFDVFRIAPETGLPVLADAKGRSVLGVPQSDGEPFELTSTWDGSLPAGVYTLTNRQAIGFMPDLNLIIDPTLKLTLSPSGIPLPTALRSGGPTLIVTALLVQWRKRRALTLA